ncbi:hypothetical protein [Tropicimonas aquimaris]|uniref:Uncharacterized protein n=1 Tax=Tropicimonas aquimaris TaxID=914152 RepID=A0ABW3IW25_9RHOB
MPGLRNRLYRPALVAGCVVLAACGAPQGPDTPASATGGGPVVKVADPVFAADRIRAGTTGQEIDFGRAEPGAVAAMAKLMGSRASSVGPACPGLRAARWPDGTTLFFAPQPYDLPALVGWQTSDASSGRTCGA